MKHYILLILSIFLSSISTLAQNNLIRNSGFEDGSPDPVRYSFDFKNLDVWENNFWDSPVTNALDWHSTDWFKVGSFDNWGTPAHSALGYIGLVDYELAQQKFSANNRLEEGSVYEVKMFIYLESSAPSGSTPVFDKSELVVYLAKHKMEYEQEDDEYPFTERCKDDYKTLKTGGTQDIIKHVVVSDLTVFSIDNWHEVSVVFTAPSSNYNWFGIEVVANPGWCDNAYVLIDDVSLCQGCLNVCSRTDGCINPVIGKTHIPVQNGWWFIDNLDNVTSAHILIHKQGDVSNLIRTIDVTSINGITEPIFWDGKDEFGNEVLPSVYAYFIELTNECGTQEYPGTISKSLWPDTPTPPVAVYNNSGIVTPSPCCGAEPDIVIDGVFLPGVGSLEYQAVNNITVSPTSFVTVTSNADVLLQAGNRIVLNPGFSTEPGANFIAEIVPCDFITVNKTSNGNDESSISFDEEKSEIPVKEEFSTDFAIHPNPTSGQFTIQVTGDKGQGTSEIFIYDLLGNLVYQLTVVSSQSTVIDISTHPKGVYFVKVVQEYSPPMGEMPEGQRGLIFTQKLIHQ